ncbi:hypothetical protein FRC17_002673 [Serendipita sp. 399]|nr:hypothetical protein FRC17_002673 [Serendipita sp. 399]
MATPQRIKAEHEYDLNDQERKSQLAYSDQRVKLIRDTLSTLLPTMKAYRNRNIPIFRLADEILIEIWSYGSMEDQVSVSQVCQRWRRSSLSASKLWTELNFDKEPTRKLFLFLKRAGNSPLHITNMSERNTYVQMPSVYTANYNAAFTSLGLCGHGCSHAMFNRVVQPIPPIRPTLHHPQTVFPINHFREITQRARFLEACVNDDDTAYVNHETLNRPMAHLHCLILSYSYHSPNPYFIDGAVGPWKELTQWFGGVTPQLKELYLSQIHAPWDDRIYSNLTHLQLSNPFTKARPHQLLRILARCPMMEYLDIANCFSRSLQGVSILRVDDGRTNSDELLTFVTLKRLWYLHFDESDDDPFSRFLSRIHCPALETLVICAPTLASFTAFTDSMAPQPSFDNREIKISQPLEIFRSFFSRTTRVTFSMCSSKQFTAIGHFSKALSNNNERWMRRGQRIEKSPEPGWSFSCNFQPSDPRDFLNQAESIGLRLHHIESIEIKGEIGLGTMFYNDLFSRCSHLKWLKIHAFYVPLKGRPRRKGRISVDYLKMTPNVAIAVLTTIIKDGMCPELETLEMKGNIVAYVRDLTQWLESRAQKRWCLKRLVVDVFVDDTEGQSWELGNQARAQIEKTLEPRDPSNKSEESGLIWTNTRNSRKMPFVSGRGLGDPDEEEYQEWLGDPQHLLGPVTFHDHP